DQLTGLGNRTMFLRRLEETLATPHAGQFVGVLLFDLDGFQNLNDNLGHRAGDQVLIETVSRFRQALKQSAVDPPCVLARVGDDEFAVLMEAALPEQAEALAKTLLSCLSQPFRLDNS